MRISCHVSWALVIILSAVSSGTARAERSNESQAKTTRAEQWRADLQFLLEELPIRHANLYHSISKDEFVQAADHLNQRIPDLTDNHVIVEFARLTALVGDGHTGLFFPFDKTIPFHKYPIEVWAVSDGYIIAAASPDLAGLVGKKLVRVADQDISQVVAAVEPLAPGDNLFSKLNKALMFLPIPEVLEALGVIQQAFLGAARDGRAVYAHGSDQFIAGNRTLS